MKFLKKLTGTFVVLSAALLITSCTSLQQDVVKSTEQHLQIEDLQVIEKQVAEIDVNIINGVLSSMNKDEKDAMFTDLLGRIDLTIDDLGQNSSVLARLLALKGMVYYFDGKKAKAKECYNQAIDSFKGDAETMILGCRLGIIEDISDKNIFSMTDDNPLIVLEQAVQLYIKGNYPDSVAKFDSSFVDLAPFYRECYSVLRNRAWELRNVESSNDNVLLLMQKNQITVGEMLLITQDSTSLVEQYTAGKVLKENDLFQRLEKAGLLNSVSNTEQSELNKDDILTRVYCARFLWNMYNARKNNTDVTKYSKVFREMEGAESPITDVNLDSEDFDAVLGCVENEIMDLPDGESFGPQLNVSGSQFNGFVKAVK